MSKAQNIVSYVRRLYNEPDAFIPLHEPRFRGNEKKYVNETIDSTFVSSVGAFVDEFERRCAEKCGARYAVATVNGTAALHVALKLAGVQEGDLVLTQAFTFIATGNAITYTGAEPYFIDVDKDIPVMCPDFLRRFLEKECEKKESGVVNRESGRVVKACVPMHSFGQMHRIDELAEICEEWGITLIEDAAESIGSSYKGKPSGSFGKMGILSFNGNKVITTGGGGMIVTDDEELAKHAKHLTTQAKVPHKWDFIHDEIGYNYRLPNINAALGCAQIEMLDEFVENKRDTAALYERFCVENDIAFLKESEHCRSNYWLNAILLKDKQERDAFLKESNDAGVMTRPAWELLHRLPMFAHCGHDELANSINFRERLVNIPSSVRINE